MLLTTLVGAFVLTLPGVAEPTQYSMRVESYLSKRSAVSQAQPRTSRIDARPSKHRDTEGGAVILELGSKGLRPVHCHGHAFPAADR
jgi:hypothetical protein